MRFHVLAICHTRSSKEQLACAFTQKVVKFCDMMFTRDPVDIDQKKTMTPDELVRHRQIHYLIHYGHERSEVACDEHVTVMTDDILIQTYGEYNWRKQFFKHCANDLCHTTFTANTIREMAKRIHQGDIILCFWGIGHKLIAQAFQGVGLVVEPGIGYPSDSAFADFRVYESYAVMHYHYGWDKLIQGVNYHAVIPNYFDPDDFTFREKKDNYFLYLGRIIQSKGLQIILILARTMGFRLVIAGQGDIETELGQIGMDLPDNIELVGFADLEKRKRLMAGAKALFLPTQYIEPFGGVTLEALMSGTPVITTDWGVFTETIPHGVVGYRCRTLGHYEWAINNIDQIRPQACRGWAMANFSLSKVRDMYEEYFDMLLKVKFNAGFMYRDPERTQLDWLTREMPLTALTLPLPQKQDTLKRKKVLWITETKWAFGRIFRGLEKFITECDLTLWNWNQGFPCPRSLSESEYDVIYATNWDTARRLELFLEDDSKQHPEFFQDNNLNSQKIIFTAHGLVDFIKLKFNDVTADRAINRKITAQEVDSFNVDPELIQWLNSRTHAMGVVSHELFRRLLQVGLREDKLLLTPCGVDRDLFHPDDVVHQEIKSSGDQPLRVLYPFQQAISSSEFNKQGYDVKRRVLASLHLKDKLSKVGIELIFTPSPNGLTASQMPDFYHKGDIYLCLSHSEGNPLGILEAGASGLCVVTTPVGIIPELIQHQKNGLLLPHVSDQFGRLEEAVISTLQILNRNRNLIKLYGQQLKSDIEDKWTWSHVSPHWVRFLTQEH
jgi:glycosyltransferase involved in cell wall biosynthesis